MQDANRTLNRDEEVLLRYFRALPPEEQIDLLNDAEIRFDATERRKELSSREVERGFDDASRESWRH